MTLIECYLALGGDYQDVISRLRTDERVKKFLIKFLDDTSYQNLSASLQAENYEEAFRAAHTLKGVSQNLGFTKLYKSSSAMADLLRDRQKHDASNLMKQVDADYKQLTDAVHVFLEG